MENLNCGYLVFEKYSEMVASGTSKMIFGTKCYCHETDREYRWQGEEIGWMEVPYKIIEKPIIKEEKVYQYPEFKGLELNDGEILLKRNDGTVALRLGLDDDEESKLVFYNKKGEAVGVLNSKIFE